MVTVAKGYNLYIPGKKAYILLKKVWKNYGIFRSHVL